MRSPLAYLASPPFVGREVGPQRRDLAKRLDGEPPVVVTPGVCRQASPTRIIGPCRATGSTRGTVAQTAAQRDQVTRRAVWRARVEHGTHALAAAESMSAVVAPLAGLSGALRHNRRRAPFSGTHTDRIIAPPL